MNRAALPLAAALLLAGCAAGAGGSGDRYPEQKRPEPARNAADDKMLGASDQDPGDTLEGSLTNLHAAPRGPGTEVPENEAAHERLAHEECEERANEAAAADSAAPGARKRPVCPPPAEGAASDEE